MPRRKLKLGSAVITPDTATDPDVLAKLDAALPDDVRRRYHARETAALLGISYNTLQSRVREGVMIPDGTDTRGMYWFFATLHAFVTRPPRTVQRRQRAVEARKRRTEAAASYRGREDIEGDESAPPEGMIG
jgi:hypothetical protein